MQVSEEILHEETKKSMEFGYQIMQLVKNSPLEYSTIIASLHGTMISMMINVDADPKILEGLYEQSLKQYKEIYEQKRKNEN
jgi:hypothetical protein